MDEQFRVFPLGDSALTVDFGNVISPELNDKAIALCDRLESAPFPGFIETVPAYSSATVFYDLLRVRNAFPQHATAFEAVKQIVLQVLAESSAGEKPERPTVEIPAYFDGENGPDLEYVADVHEIATNEVINIFLSRTYRVYMLGFLPGFTYMGEVDERLATPRKDSPRTSLAPGSIGIAGRQTGIYSISSPGGWQIIGRTGVEMFTPFEDRPTYLQAGDEVRFVKSE